jgi:Acetyltransferases
MKTTFNLIMRQAVETDIKTIADFQVAMALETENFRLNSDSAFNGVKACIKDLSKGRYYVVEDLSDSSNKKIVGCIMVMSEWSDWRCTWVWWLMSLYVLPEYRKQGVFKLMYNRIKEMANADSSVSGIRLYVDKRNERAQKVYSAIGMCGEHYTLFEWMK